MSNNVEASRIFDVDQDSKSLREIKSYQFMSTQQSVGTPFGEEYYGGDEINRRGAINKGFHNPHFEAQERRTTGDANFARCNGTYPGVKLLTFNGSSQKVDFLDWIDTLEDYFQATNPPDAVKCKLATSKLKGEARTWWNELQNHRFSEGMSFITSWSSMRDLLHERFLNTSRLTWWYNQENATSVQPSMCSTKVHNQSRERETQTIESLHVVETMPSNCSMKCPSETYSSSQSENCEHKSGPEAPMVAEILMQAEENGGDEKHNNSLMICPSDSYHSLVEDKHTTEEAKGTSDENEKVASTKSVTIEQSKESVVAKDFKTDIFMPVNCLIELPFEPNINKHDEERELRSLGVSRPNLEDTSSVENSEKSESWKPTVGGITGESKPQGLKHWGCLDLLQSNAKEIPVKEVLGAAQGIYKEHIGKLQRGIYQPSQPGIMAVDGCGELIGVVLRICQVLISNLFLSYGTISAGMLSFTYDPGGIFCSIRTHITSFRTDLLPFLLFRIGFVMMSNHHWEHGIVTRDEVVYRDISCLHKDENNLVFLMRKDCGTCVPIPIQIDVQYSYLGFHGKFMSTCDLIPHFMSLFDPGGNLCSTRTQSTTNLEIESVVLQNDGGLSSISCSKLLYLCFTVLAYAYGNRCKLERLSWGVPYRVVMYMVRFANRTRFCICMGIWHGSILGRLHGSLSFFIVENVSRGGVSIDESSYVLTMHDIGNRDHMDVDMALQTFSIYSKSSIGFRDSTTTLEFLMLQMHVLHILFMFDPGGNLYFSGTSSLNEYSLHGSYTSLMITTTHIVFGKNALLMVIGETKQGYVSWTNLLDDFITALRSDQLVKGLLLGAEIEQREEIWSNAGSIQVRMDIVLKLWKTMLEMMLKFIIKHALMYGIGCIALSYVHSEWWCGIKYVYDRIKVIVDTSHLGPTLPCSIHLVPYETTSGSLFGDVIHFKAEGAKEENIAHRNGFDVSMERLRNTVKMAPLGEINFSLMIMPVNDKPVEGSMYRGFSGKHINAAHRKHTNEAFRFLDIDVESVQYLKGDRRKEILSPICEEKAEIGHWRLLNRRDWSNFLVTKKASKNCGTTGPSWALEQRINIYSKMFGVDWQYNLRRDIGISLARGGTLPWEGWNDRNDENNANTQDIFIRAKICVVILSIWLSILSKGGHLRKTLRLFCKMVNGLDPPTHMKVKMDGFNMDSFNVARGRAFLNRGME